MATHNASVYPLFKGCTRLAMVFGVPIIPLMGLLITTACIAMLISLWWWFLSIPCWLIMRQICRYDDKAFRILGLWIDTRLRNRNLNLWQASSYTPHNHKWVRR